MHVNDDALESELQISHHIHHLLQCCRRSSSTFFCMKDVQWQQQQQSEAFLGPFGVDTAAVDSDASDEYYSVRLQLTGD